MYHEDTSNAEEELQQQREEDRLILQTTVVERYAMMVLYFSAATESVSSQSDKWKNWGSKLSICDWDEGIECNDDIHEGCVSKINLSKFYASFCLQE